MLRAVRTFTRLRWRLLRGAIRHGGTEQVGVDRLDRRVRPHRARGGHGAARWPADRVSHVEDLAVLVCSLVLLAVVGFGIVAGISQPIDPRVIAAEPLTDRDRTVGLLAAAAFGPPGLAGIALGIGLGRRHVRGVDDVPISAFAVASWLLSLLLVARTATNLLALMASRFPALGQLVVGLAGLVFYGAFQFVPSVLGRLEGDGRARLPRRFRMDTARPDRAGTRRRRSRLGAPARGFGLDPAPGRRIRLVGVRTVVVDPTRRRPRHDERRARADRDGWRGGCAVTAPTGAIAWRSILTRFRTPRTALETFTGAGVGIAAVLVPTLLSDDAGSGAVLVGGAVQLACCSCPATASAATARRSPTSCCRVPARERSCVARRGASRSSPPRSPSSARSSPLRSPASGGISLAGFGVGVGGLLAGTGAAVVQSTMVPIAIPESDNPFAGGESGKGLLAALLLVVVLAGLAIVTIPVALGTALGDRPGPRRARHGVRRGHRRRRVGCDAAGVAIATNRLTGREPEFIAAVTPAR